MNRRKKEEGEREGERGREEDEEKDHSMISSSSRGSRFQLFPDRNNERNERERESERKDFD